LGSPELELVIGMEMKVEIFNILRAQERLLANANEKVKHQEMSFSQSLSRVQDRGYSPKTSKVTKSSCCGMVA
jgi:hypothetical protein